MSIHKNVRLLAWFNFFTDFKLYSGIAIIYFTQVAGSIALGMSIFAITNIADAVFEVPTGILSDMVGRRKTIILGAVSSVVYSVFYAIGVSYWMLVLGAIFQGLSIAFYSGNNEALLHDSLKEQGKEKDYHVFLGKISSLFQLALAIGAVLGSFLASQSFYLVMWLSAISQIICLVISFFIVEPKIKIKKSSNIYLHIKDALILFRQNKKLRVISFASILGSAIGEATFQLQAIFYNILWPLWAIGFAKFLSYLGATLSFFFSGKIINKIREIKAILAGSIYTRMINIFSLLFPSVFSPVLMSSTSLFYGVSSVAKNSLLQKEFTPHQRATIASLNSLGESILFAIFAIFFGYIGDVFGPAKTLLLAQIIALIPLYLYWKIYKLKKQ